MRTLDRLISHRFRGFSEFENTLEGLNAALSFGVQRVEFDIRIAKCGTPMIYHDEYAKDEFGKKRNLSEIMAVDFTKIGGTFKRIPNAEALFKTASNHHNKTAKFLVDIKDGGFETEIHALICFYKLQSRVIYVSWLPEVLYNLHEISPKSPLCLSHWCQSPDKKTRKIHKVFTAKNGIIHPPKAHSYIHGQRSGWFVEGTLQGELRRILKVTRGWVCVPKNMITREHVEDYQGDGIQVSTFSYTDWDTLKSHENNMSLDGYFIDNKIIFDEMEAKGF